jgi:hypothetical protein
MIDGEGERSLELAPSKVAAIPEVAAIVSEVATRILRCFCGLVRGIGFASKGASDHTRESRTEQHTASDA